MRKLFSISEAKETRLWNRYMSNTFEPLNKPESTIQDAGLYQGQVRLYLGKVLTLPGPAESFTWARGELYLGQGRVFTGAGDSFYLGKVRALPGAGAGFTWGRCWLCLGQGSDLPGAGESIILGR